MFRPETPLATARAIALAAGPQGCFGARASWMSAGLVPANGPARGKVIIVLKDIKYNYILVELEAHFVFALFQTPKLC